MDSDLRVAIVGFGPKGLFALERLLHHLDGRCRIAVDAYEPHEAPGAGPVYDPCQPDYLRMNIAAERLDLWPGDNSAVPSLERRSFGEWTGRRSPQGDERYPPRALVGRYLADGLERMRARMPEGMRFRVAAYAVDTVAREGLRWSVHAGEGPCEVYDEVLLTTGHGTWRAPVAPRAWPRAAHQTPAVFPVGRWLAPGRIPPGSAVGVRGFALTFIDAALALTEGRGGAFEGDGHPYRRRYVASPGAVRAIVPFSRTGRPMLAKPEPALAASIAGLAEIAGSGRDRILARPAPVALGDLLEIIAATAAAGLQAADHRRPGGERMRAVTAVVRRGLEEASAGRPGALSARPAAEIERSLAVGAGLARPGIAWALGHAWQALYPALVERVAPSSLAPAAWPGFRRLAGEMERIAFGPPPVNAAKVLALIDAGTVDLTYVAGGRVVEAPGGPTCIGDARGRRTVDVVVDAVLPSPGVGADSLASRLVADGHARPVRGRRGLEVTDSAACVGQGGGITQGLSAIGRVTEDCIIGNDTLFRHLHPHTDRWARRMAERARETGRSSPISGRGRVTA